MLGEIGELVGIFNSSESHFVRGEKFGKQYQITEHDERFLLNHRTIGIGIGPMLEPVAYFDKSFEGIYRLS